MKLYTDTLCHNWVGEKLNQYEINVYVSPKI